MRFLAAVIVQILMGLFLIWGILQAVHGSLWLLVVGVLAYLLVFARAGCASH